MCATVALLPGFGRGQDVNSLMSEWSIVTAGNLYGINEFQGRAYVGGDVAVPNSFNVATAGGISPGTVSLAVGGNIDSGGNIQVNGGSVVVGGSILGGRTFNLNSGGTVQQQAASLPASPVPQFAAASGYWATLPANSAAPSVNASGQLEFACAAGASVAVFDVNASALADPNHALALSPSSATKDVIINIAGTAVNINANFIDSFTSLGSKVVINCPTATTVNLATSIYGYVVAPTANVIAGDDIFGGVMAGSLTVDSEVDNPGWNGNVPAISVPEPSTWLAGAALAGLLSAGWLGRRLWKSAE
jgi:choice-of-anchor A domain-containing protein